MLSYRGGCVTKRREHKEWMKKMDVQWASGIGGVEYL